MLALADMTAEQRTLAVRLRSSAMKMVEEAVARKKLDHSARRRVERAVEVLVNEIVEAAAIEILDSIDTAVDQA